MKTFAVLFAILFGVLTMNCPAPDKRDTTKDCTEADIVFDECEKLKIKTTTAPVQTAQP